MGISIKKPFGSKNNFVRRTARNPTGAAFGLGGALINDYRQNERSKTDEYNKQRSDAANRETVAQDEFTRLGQEEERRYNEFATEYAGKAKSFRDQLASTLAKQNLESFKLANPYILQDLNARGLFTSPTGVDQAQTEALKELELDRQSKLTAFDTNAFGQEVDYRGNALSSALEMQRAKLQRTFDVADQESARRTAEYLAKKQARNQLIAALISGGSNVASGALAGA